MKLAVKHLGETEVELEATFDAKELSSVKGHVIGDHRNRVKAAGFRPGHAPDAIVERELGDQHLQTEVVESAAQSAFRQAIEEHKLRPLNPPHVEIRKYVPASELELVFRFEVMPKVKLADYKQIKRKLSELKIEPTDIESVIEGLRARAGKRTPKLGAAEAGDELILDFVGSRDGILVPGASGKAYPALLGSGRFVKGFEEALIGTKPGEKRQFDIIFPDDYPEPTLQSKKVHFEVEAKAINAIKLPAVDDKFASMVGPFTSLTQLKDDITKQLKLQHEADAKKLLTNQLVAEVSEKSQLSLPPGLVKKQQEALWNEFEADAKRAQMTTDQYLESLGKSKTEIDALLAKQAGERVRTALVLNAVAEQENIKVSSGEIELRLQAIKSQYQDAAMQAGLDRPAARNEIADQLLIEKAVAKLVEYATK